MPEIEVGDTREEKGVDARSGTQNTKLATALLVMGFQLAKQPFTTVPRIKLGRIEGADTTIWFIPVAKWNESVLIFEDVEREWRFRAMADVGNSPLPEVAWMRAALTSREDTMRNVVNGRGVPHAVISNLWFQTDEFKLASCLIGSGYPLQAYKDRRFYFNPDAARAAGVYKRDGGREAMQWMKLAVHQIEILVAAIRGPGNSPLIRVANRTTGSLLTMTAATPPDLQRVMLHELHKPI